MARPLDHRKTTSTRITPELRGRLDEAAALSGRSIAQEIELRLGRSFRDEDALIDALGGRETYGVLKVMGSVAGHIQTRTGKTVADWKTGLAIGRAWKRLIIDWVQRPPAEWIAELQGSFDEMPDAPVAPEPPEAPAQGGLLAPPASEEERETYRANWQTFEKDREAFLIAAAEYQRIYDQSKAALRKKIIEINEAAGIGEEVLGLLSDQDE